MQVALKIPKLDLDAVKILLTANNFIGDTATTKRTRKSPVVSFENIIVNDIFFGDGNVENVEQSRTLFANVSEVKTTAKKTNRKQEHFIEVKFFRDNEKIESVVCAQCEETKVQCNAISSYMHWIECTQLETCNAKENVPVEENVTKKIKLTNQCFVVLQKVIFNPPSKRTVAPVLVKLKKEPTPITPQQLKSAETLSMISLITEYRGNNAEDFVKFCSNRMARQSCSSIEFLTIEQADTALWHELRKGRITASRMHEASRCTMLNGSLTNKIMGVSSGFSFAMKRGTDLEGHVLAELQKEYPALRSSGLVLDPQCAWMGASPDGICDEFVLEIKCPYTQKTYDCYVDVKKLSKKYFAQIQLQMHMTHKQKALLAVAAVDFETTRKIAKVWIDYDKAYVNQIMEESYEFWCKAVFKALLKKRNSKK